MKKPIQQVKLIIIGSGPAGYTAAVYAARANLQPLLFEGFYSGPAGGQLTTTTEVENYPGFPKGVSGPELVQLFKEQALRFGTKVLPVDVKRVDLNRHPFRVFTEEVEYETQALIIATGATAKRLDIPGSRDGELWQKGVTACAVCDGANPIFRNRPLYVIGGGDSAMEEALFLTHYGSRVYIVHRRDALRASKIMAKRAMEHPKIEILWNSVIASIEGDPIVQRVQIENIQTHAVTTHEAGGVFFAIGHLPNTAFLDGQLRLDENLYITVEPGTCRTTIEGVFAAGDVQDHVYRQAVTAAGTGCMAALEAERWLAARETHS